jgi:hypothetical protein
MSQVELNHPNDPFGEMLVAFLRAHQQHLNGAEPPSSVKYSRSSKLDGWKVTFDDACGESATITVDTEEVLGWMWRKLGNLLSPSGY